MGSGRGHRSNIEVFERILEQVGLSSEIDPKLKRNLIELEQVRNILLHKGAIVDSRFLEICPWIGATAGTRFVPDNQHVMKYLDAVIKYGELMRVRIASYFAPKPSPATP